MTHTATETGTGRRGARLTPGVPLSPVEHALLRLLVSGRPLAEAAPALGLSLGQDRTAARSGAPPRGSE